MGKALRIGIIGDYDPGRPSYPATVEALGHAATALRLQISPAWLPTQSLQLASSKQILETFDGLWAAPGSPYRSMPGALQAIQFARQAGKPFIGT
jgi:CTP synthase (UTP-ammonia lyase)